MNSLRAIIAALIGYFPEKLSRCWLEQVYQGVKCKAF